MVNNEARESRGGDEEREGGLRERDPTVYVLFLTVLFLLRRSSVKVLTPASAGVVL